MLQSLPLLFFLEIFLIHQLYSELFLSWPIICAQIIPKIYYVKYVFSQDFLNMWLFKYVTDMTALLDYLDFFTAFMLVLSWYYIWLHYSWKKAYKLLPIISGTHQIILVLYFWKILQSYSLPKLCQHNRLMPSPQLAFVWAQTCSWFAEIIF